MKGLAGRLLDRPEVEVIEDLGRTTLFVRLQRRPRKAVRATQPDPDVMIYLYLDGDGAPVGVTFLEFVPRAVMFRVLREAARPFLFKEPLLVERLMQSFECAAEKMPEPVIGTT